MSISGCWRQWGGAGSQRGKREGLQKDLQKRSGLTDGLNLLILMMISWVYVYVKIYQLVYLKSVQRIICQLPQKYCFKRFLFHNSTLNITSQGPWVVSL